MLPPLDPGAFGDLGSLLRARAARDPDRRAFTFLADGEHDEQHLTYGELDQAARGIAAALQAAGATGGRALILEPAGLGFVQAFMGCLYAGVTAVPVPAPFHDERRMARTLPRLKAIAADAGTPFVLAPSAVRARAAEHVPDARWLDPADPAAWTWVPPGELAFLQYSSGSTGTPKGVMVGHFSLMHNLAAIRAAFGHHEGSVGVSWLPAYHDMGLVADVLQPLYAGFPLAFMSPFDFIARPLRWLEAVSRFGATTSGAPNFAYALLAERATDAEVAALDLSRWDVAYTCAEPVQADVVARFHDRFRAAGLRDGATFPYLGMAEATLMVTAGSRTEAPRVRDGRVSCGKALPGQRVAIVDPETGAARPDGETGEIWVLGPSVASGYWGRESPEFAGVLEGRGGWLKTGDLGLLDDGELFVAGRLKDLIILQGQNHWPQDLERTAEAADPRVRGGCSAAFAVDEAGGERLVVVAEVSEAAGVAAAIQAELLAAHGVVGEVALLPPGALPKTSSGKVQRQGTKAAWLEGRLPVLETGALAVVPAAEAPFERTMAALLGELLGVDVGPEDRFLDLGGHSLLAARLAARVRDRFGVELPLRAAFEAPTVRELAARVAAAGGAALPPLEARGLTGPQPLSYAQERMWAASGLAPYVIPLALRFDEPPDPAALEARLQALIARHPALRTRFTTAADGSPRQVVEDAVPFTLGRGGDAQEVAHAPFDLGVAPLFRASLVEPDLLVIAVHHLVCDGWSLGVLAQDLQREAAPPAVDYLDYAAWQRDWLDGPVLDQQLTYWRGALQGAPELLQLPTDHPRPASQAYQGGVATFTLDAATTEAVTTRAREAGATPFMLLLAAFQALLHRQAGQADICVGVPVANRRVAALEPLVGFFANTLVIRIGVDAAPAFDDLLAQVRARCLDAYAHQDLPFEKLVEALNPRRSPGHHPLFQAMFVLQDAAMTRFPGATSTEAGAPAAKFDLLLELLPDGDGLRGRLEYDAALFDPASAARLAAQYQRLLAAALAAPATPIARLPLLAPAERTALLALGDARGQLPADDRPVHTRFEAEADAHPDRLALWTATETLTYGELEARANRLAHLLVAQGVGTGMRVGVCLSRDAELVVALLAVLKAGAAYVPLDPAYPAARLAWIREDARLDYLLDAPVDASLFPPKRPNRTPGPLSHIIYTSGSTGTPKGVAIRHAATAARASWAAKAFTPAELARVLAATSICFDLSVFELFAPLTTGGAAVLVPDVLALADLPADAAPTLINTVPSAIEPLLALGAIPASVLTVNLAGEPLKTSLVDALHARSGVQRVNDLYGPSEDTTYSTWTRRVPGGPATIGRPLPGTCAFVLDGAMQPVPLGVPGELWLGGAGLAAGYVGRPDLTSERFVEAPFEAGLRLYRTGDVARWLSDGNLAFLGRADHQVKLRGHRIELGEIERHLERHPGVREAVVVARGERLAAYVLPDAAAPAADAEQVAQWRAVYEAAYAADGETEDFTGWSSAWTGEAIPLADMRAWRDATVERIRGLNPRKVYEIGCGTGLLLGPLAGEVDAYWASDLAAPAVARLEARALPGVTALHRPADDFAGLPARGFDTVVLNSVAQYFPSAAYLETVIAGAVSATADGGRIFVGDVRDLAKLPAFHAAALGADASEAAVARRIAREEELCLAPGWFEALVGRIPRLRGVVVLRKSGEYTAELREYRYDVVLTVGPMGGKIGGAAGAATAENDGPTVGAATAESSGFAAGARGALLSAQTQRPPLANEPARARLAPQLRDWLTERVPAFMVPADILVLDALPLTPNGKVDRRALPDPAPDEAAPPTDYAAPRGEPQATLCRLFEAVLGRAPVGIHDDFFALGGHSLLATRLAARIRAELGAELPLRALFEAPTVAGLALRLARPIAATAPQPEALPPGAPIPLSYAQERLVFMDQLTAAGALYNIPVAFRLHGPLDAGKLGTAFDACVARHEALRLRVAGDQLVPGPAPTLTIQDALAPDRVLKADAEAPFDLAQGPLMRATLQRVDADDHLLGLTVHHLVADGWSLGSFMQELAAAYAGDPLPPPAVRYADYAAGQRAWLATDAYQAQLAHWTARLQGAPAMLTLPTDRPRPAVERHAGAKRHFRLPRALTDDLLALARAEGVTPFMLLLSAFYVLLHRYSGQADLSVGVPWANRRSPGTEGVFGLFTNTLVLRADLAGAPAFRDLLRQVRQVALDADTHQELPFEKLVEALNPPRSLSHHPLFQVMFALQDAAGMAWALPAVEVEALALDGRLAKFDLSLDLMLEPDGLAGRLEYNTDLFDGATIDRLVGHLGVLLAGVAAAPATPITQLPLLTNAERTTMLDTWNATAKPYPEAPLHALIAEQVARTPDAIAAEFAGTTLTYAALDAAANRLAHHLAGRGVGPDVRVGLCLERGLDLLVAVLGIMKAGGAYVALDPGYPAERVRFMADDARCALVVTHSDHAHLLGDAPLLQVDVDRWDHEPDTAPETAVGPDHLLSIIYTSGSTGRPKGVMNLHRGAVNHLLHRQGAYRMGPDDRIMQKTSLNFDGSVWELFWPLLVGARVVLAPPAAQKDGGYLLDFVQQHGITMIDFVPSMLAEVLADPRLKGCTSLRRFFVGGELMPKAIADQLLATCPWAALTHGYGPTETTVSVLYHDCQANDPRPVVPIGKPNRNIRAYVLDAHGQPVPVGVAGELHLGGDGLARGYLDRPELTAEKFVETPWGRLYKSGDLARWLADGVVEFLGRVDHQVKIRGFRIELGEIEARLLAHADVREAVVLAREDAPGEKRLVAYVAGSTDAGTLRAHLRAALPDHMVPAAFVALDKLPLDPNGKVDRRALPAPGTERDAAVGAYAAPRDATEDAVCQAFAAVLGLDRVGIHDDFFDLGGHSLLATRLASRLREALATELPLRRIFEAPTPAGLAATLGSAGAAALPAIAPLAPSVPKPTSFAQERLWFLDQLEPGQALYNIPAAYGIEGPLDADRLADAFAVVLARHDALRTRFPAAHGRPVQVVDAPGAFDLKRQDLRAEADPEQAARAIAESDAQAPFDLAAGPLVRAQLLRVADGAHVLVLNVHHIVADGWSWPLLLADLDAAYRGRALAPLAVQYADYAAWQRTWLAGEAFEAQLAYWRARLAGLPERLDLPTDRPRPAVSKYQGARVELALEPDLLGIAEAAAKAAGVTPFMWLLAAFQALLHRWSGHDDLAVGVPIAGRRTQALEPLVGFFVNTLVLRADFAAGPTFAAFVDQVKAGCLDAYAHQDLPFEKLVEELNPARSLGWHPLFQVLFVLQEAQAAATLAGAPLQPVPLAARQSRFDLALELLPGPDGLTARVEYDRDLFDAGTVERLVAQLGSLIRGAAAAPETPVAELPLLADGDCIELAAWNATDAPFDGDLPAQALVLAWAEAQPDAPALVWGDETTPYAALADRVRRLACRLAGAGVTPGQHVGLQLDRGPDLIVAMLAVLEAGAVFVPLDPAYPADRLAYMTEDAALSAVILSPPSTGGDAGRQGWVGHLEPRSAPTHPPADADPRPSRAGAQIIWLDEEGPLATLPEPDPDGLAYVIYTSGSTGAPKGALLGHRGLCNLIAAARATYGLAPGRRMLQFASPSFDAAVFEVFATLGNGATLVLASRDALMPGPGLATLLVRQRVDTLGMPPSAFAHQPLPAAGSALSHVIMAGEALPPALAEAWARHVAVFNAYGPTEATVWSSVHRYRPGSGRAPIGAAIPNVRLHVLDAAGQPVPVGVVGELHVGGPGVARGYHDRPDLTATRFLDAAGEALYRTGDRVRRRPDGELDFLGRVDQQVKVRGFRIEPGEVEAALLAEPGVREAVVLARGEALVAWVAADPEAAPPAAEAAQVDQWRALYDQAETDDDPEDDFTGWNSSFTGEPIPLAEMRAWRDATVARIQALNPRRVYEIGCGNGLLAAPLAPGCAEYWASDLAAPAVARVQALGLPGAIVLQRPADDFSKLPAGYFDVVVLNSVAQYFPSAGYLRRVLEGAARLLAPGGRIFVGDVRDLTKLEAFHAEVLAAQGRDPADAARRADREEELCLAPAFFGPDARVLPKAGAYTRELRDYRYDVVLTGPPPAAPPGSASQPLRGALAGALKQALAAKLPAHLVPAHVVVLDALPTTPNGKVDRAALPAPEAGAARQVAYVAPQGPAEEALCALFAEALGAERVGATDDFFALGGHSLLAIQLVARIRARFGVELPLRRLFEAPTPAGLAIGLGLPGGGAAAPAALIPKAPPGAATPLAPAQAMWWTLFPRVADLAHGIQSSYAALRVTGPLDLDRLEAAAAAVVARHEALRTTFADPGRKPRRVVHAAMPAKLARHEAADEAQAMAGLQAAALADFDLERGPLFRFAAWRVAADRHVLLVAVSHLVSDGWSMKVLLGDLSAAYGGEALPAPRVDYSDYVRWQRKRLRGLVPRQLAYWLKQGRDMPVVLDLPTDKPRPAVLSLAGGCVAFQLPADLTAGLEGLARAEGVTPYMLLLGAFQVLLHRWTGHADVFVGTPVANRPTAETEKMIGLFLNFVVLRGDLRGKPAFRAYLQRVRATCVGAFANQDLPFHVLLRGFQAWVRLTRLSGFAAERTARSNVMFNLVEDVGAGLRLGGLAAELLPLSTPYAAQALHLILTRRPDGLGGHLIYDADLFEHATAERLAREYEALLRAILADPDQAVGIHPPPP